MIGLRKATWALLFLSLSMPLGVMAVEPVAPEKRVPEESIDPAPSLTGVETILLRGSASENRVLSELDDTTLEEPDVSTYEVDIPALVSSIARKNLDVAILGAQVVQAKGYLNQAIGGLFPSIRPQSTVESLRGGEIFVGAVPFPVDRLTYQGRVGVDYNISLGGKALFTIQAAKNQLDRVKHSHEQSFQKALLDTLQQYYTLLRDTSLVDVAEQSLKEANAQLAYNKSRFDAGFATKLDVAQSEVLQAERQSDLLRAQNQREISAIALASLLDMPLNFQLLVDRSQLVPTTYLDADTPLQQLFETALELRQDVKEANEQIAEAKARYKSARADIFPTLTLSGYKRRIGQALDQTQETRQLFSSVSIDVLRNLGWDVLSNMQVYKGRVQEAELNKLKRLNDIQRTLGEAFEDSKYQHALMGTTAKKAAAALEAYKISAARLREGFGTNFEVVQAQKDLTDARAEYQTAVMNYNNAQLKLLFESGQLTAHRVLFTHQQQQQPMQTAAQ